MLKTINKNANNNDNTRKFLKGSLSATHPQPKLDVTGFLSQRTEQNVDAKTWKQVFSARSR
jgi:hypothetical protein